jgi:MoaA/NifB/PqqE/SkfB family radical SAM enzyme
MLVEGRPRLSARTVARRKLLQAKRGLHTVRRWGLNLAFTRRPLLVHIIPMRRCNLACTYCNEYDKVSDPVPLEAMYQRIDKLAFLGTAMVGISGGEPLLHPELDEIIARVRSRGMVAYIMTNGYLLTEKRIKRLNAAGLEYFQVSIDNVNPDEVSKKSLKVLDQKLVLLAKFAEFGVNVNSVIGGGIEHPEDALVIAQRASELGFTASVGIIHEGNGNLRPLSEVEQRVHGEIKKIGSRNWKILSNYEKNLAQGKPNKWKCRAGARYLYVDEDGLVHYCSQQRGYPAIPLEKYTKEDIRREYLTKKSCAEYCTVACVQRISIFDKWRDPQTLGSAIRVSGRQGPGQPE